MPDGKVACLQCGKRLSNLNNGRRHFASAHQLNQPAKCNVCQHIFKNSQTRDSHLRQKHGLSPAMIKNAVKMPMGSTQQPMSMPTQQPNPNWSHLKMTSRCPYPLSSPCPYPCPPNITIPIEAIKNVHPAAHTHVHAHPAVLTWVGPTERSEAECRPSLMLHNHSRTVCRGRLWWGRDGTRSVTGWKSSLP